MPAGSARCFAGSSLRFSSRLGPARLRHSSGPSILLLMDRTHRRGYDREYGRDSDRDYGRDYGRRPDRDERGWFDRTTDEVRSWFGDDDAERRRRMDDRHDDRYDWRSGRSDDRDRDDRYESRYDRAGYPEPHEGWNEGARGGYGRSSYQGSGYDRDRDYDRSSSRSYGRGSYDQSRDYGGDYDRRTARDYGDRRSSWGSDERRGGSGDYGERSYRRDDQGPGLAGGYGGEYRPRASYPEYGADRYDRDSYRDYGFNGMSYGMGRR